MFKKKTLKTLHLASFNGNIGDNANHNGFYKYLNTIKDFKFKIDKLEIREFYWKKRFFDKSFVNLVNQYDLLIIGGGNYFELWVEDSPTGTSIAIELEFLKNIKTPILFNALGVDPGQGVSEENIVKFRSFLDLLIDRKDFISIRNDGAKDVVANYIGEKYLKYISHTIDAGFFAKIPKPSAYYLEKDYIAINVATDMPEVRFKNISYNDFVNEWKIFIEKFLIVYPEMEIIFVPHIFRDISFIHDILNILDDKVRRTKVSIAPFAHGSDSFEETMSIYQNAKLVLANRFHANVCSLGGGRNTIGLVNYRQIEKLYEELKSNNFVYITKKGFGNDLLNKIQNYQIDVDISNIYKQYIDFVMELKQWLRLNF